jgi:beta-glucosidase
VLFGKYNPAGRLPVTFYRSVDQLPAFTDYTMRGRTYRYFQGEPLFAFGDGLSYTMFEYSNFVLPEETKTNESVTLSVDVRNSGTRSGDEVVQLYIKNLTATVPVPLHSLQGFQRIHLNPGEQRTVQFQLQPKQLALINGQNKWIVEPGTYEISVGGHQPGASPGSSNIVSKKVGVRGTPFLIP